MTRKEAIVVLNNLRNYYSIRQGGEENAQALDFAISSLLTDEAYQLEYEKPSGKWEQINKNEVNVIPQWKCSECGAEFECFDMDFECCPRCGAKMIEPQESEVEDGTN